MRSAIAPTIERYAELVSSETLAVELRAGVVGRGHAWTGELNGTATSLELERV